MVDRPSSPDQPPQGDGERRRMPRTIASEQLLEGDRELLIQHGNDLYRLTVTRSGKLILHK